VLALHVHHPLASRAVEASDAGLNTIKLFLHEGGAHPHTKGSKQLPTVRLDVHGLGACHLFLIRAHRAGAEQQGWLPLHTVAGEQGGRIGRGEVLQYGQGLFQFHLPLLLAQRAVASV